MTFVPKKNPNVFRPKGDPIPTVGGWEQLEKLGEGGQGVVWKVRKTTELDKDAIDQYKKFCSAISQLPSTGEAEKKANRMNEIREFIKGMVGETESVGAMKILHSAEEARDATGAAERMGREIRAMAEADHPNLLKIIEYSMDDLRYVSEFHPGGVLSTQLERTSGNVVAALESIRPLVEAVDTLHQSGQVHRDIKPDNIFLSDSVGLILGDFGLVFFDDDKTRYSATFENVGSRDWMPGWAYGMRIEDVRPTFDVFSLGKIIWSMISGQPILQLWYYDKPSNDLETRFPDQPEMALVNDLLSKCVVEDESNCLSDASELLKEVDNTLNRIRVGAGILSSSVKRGCPVCGLGSYSMAVDRNITAAGNFGIQGRGMQTFRIFACDMCGHVQLFSCPNGPEADPPTAWAD